MISSTLLTQAGVDFVGRFFAGSGDEDVAEANGIGASGSHLGHLPARGHGRCGRETDLAQEGVS